MHCNFPGFASRSSHANSSNSSSSNNNNKTLRLKLHAESLQVCPAGFSPAAGGPCVIESPPPPATCDGLFHNGDVDFDGSLTVEDIEDISQYIVEEIEFTACQIFVADGMCVCVLERERGQQFDHNVVSLCAEMFEQQFRMASSPSMTWTASSR